MNNSSGCDNKSANECMESINFFGHCQFLVKPLSGVIQILKREIKKMSFAIKKISKQQARVIITSWLGRALAAKTRMVHK
jgi:hypothetical protein